MVGGFTGVLVIFGFGRFREHFGCGISGLCGFPRICRLGWGRGVGRSG